MREGGKAQASVSNIQRFSLDDGPGIRTTVFFQGCPLRCAWCHNPECIPAKPLLQFYSDHCTACGNCLSACPQSARKLVAGKLSFAREKCVACGACASACFAKAATLVGRFYDPEDLMRELVKDHRYFMSSGGGVTLSGGEPAMIPEYTAEIARLCKEAGLHVALDTAGYVPFRNYEALLPFIDLFLFDVKCIDSSLHERWVGTGNSLILENLIRLDALGVAYVIRVPVVMGFNDVPDEHERIAGVLSSLQQKPLVELLPYHSYGSGKYEMLGMKTLIKSHTPPSKSILESLLQKYRNFGLKAEIS